VTSSERIFGLAVLALSLTAVPRSALAQRSAADIESARQLYSQGVDLRDKGDLKGALEKFKAAHALGNTPITGLELCKTYSALHMPVEAREVCLGVGRIPPLQGETPRSVQARSEAASVAEAEKPKMAALRVRVRVQGQSKREPTVTVDGAAIPAAALGEPRAVDPGQHTVAGKIGSGPETTSPPIALAEGETKDVELVVAAPADDTGPPGPVGPGGPSGGGEEPSRGKPAVAIAGWTIAAIGVGVGAITGVVALNAKSDLDNQCVQKICGKESFDTLDRGKSYGTISTVFFVIGGVGLITGLYGTFASNGKAQAGALPPKQAKDFSVRPVLGLGGAGLDGTF
jgi:hypothetical protein